MKNKNLWLDDSIQFPRLIVELHGVLTEATWDELLLNMDLESDDLLALFNRAHVKFEADKIRMIDSGEVP